MSDAIATGDQEHAVAEAPSGVGTDIWTFWILVLISAPGLFNYLLNSTPFAPWKQVLILIVFALALPRVRSGITATIYWGGLAVIFILFLTSIFETSDIFAVIYNAFYYIAWLPFFVMGNTADRDAVRGTILHWSWWLIVISAVGLVIQYQTSLLDFLSFYERLPELEALSGNVRRLGFIFGSSTLVLTALGGFFYLFCTNGTTAWRRFFCMLLMVVCAIPTGSLASFVMLGGAAMIMLSRLSFKQKLGGVLVLALAAAAVLALAGGGLSGQLERVTNPGADPSRNLSNAQRFFLWAYAVDLISNFTPFQHVFGTFLGSTNAGAGGSVYGSQYLAGESSFFQSYIEGGVLASLLRVVPFLLLFAARKDRWENFWYGTTLLICCVTAPLMGAYGCQCVMAYIAGLALQKAAITREQFIAQ
jgi:hypothetical protein